ncbi:MAG: S-methyl-5'-thioadenosine phosphorylase, partial [Alphaproteobacteria bacterium]|nr:S-methyl-5'-thioadenosine phosphorylase [Alphaproteobacteria bacterium]
DHGRALVRHVAENLNTWPTAPDCGSDRALEFALITAPDARDPEMLAKLDAVAGRVLN